MNEQVIPLEAKEIKGVTFKQLAWLFGSLGTILVSVVLTYAGIVNKIDNSQKAIDELSKGYQGIQVQMKDIETKQQALEIKILTLQVQLAEKGIIPNK